MKYIEVINVIYMVDILLREYKRVHKVETSELAS